MKKYNCTSDWYRDEPCWNCEPAVKKAKPTNSEAICTDQFKK